MQAQRQIGHAPQSRALARDVAALNGPCIGCDGCEGLCQALLEAMFLPDLILKGHPA